MPPRAIVKAQQSAAESFEIMRSYAADPKAAEKFIADFAKSKADAVKAQASAEQAQRQATALQASADASMREAIVRHDEAGRMEKDVALREAEVVRLLDDLKQREELLAERELAMQGRDEAFRIEKARFFKFVTENS